MPKDKKEKLPGHYGLHPKLTKHHFSHILSGKIATEPTKIQGGREINSIFWEKGKVTFQQRLWD